MKKIPAKAPTLGAYLCKWIEQNLVHSEGDYFGQPFKLMQWQKAFIWRAYELNKDGSRRFDRALLGVGKGNGKSELAAAIAVAELAGPVVFAGWKRPGVPEHPVPRVAPDIPCAAASFEQADLLFTAAKRMITGGRLAGAFDCFDTEVMPKTGPGRLYRVAAVAGTNDGRRPTFFVADELHEWTGNKERVHLVLSNGRSKRSDAWQLAITTAGYDSTSLLGRLYAHGRRVAAGEVEDSRYLFEWWEADAEVDLGDPDALRAAVLAANPAAGPGGFLPLENVIRRAAEMPSHEYVRYFLNAWTSSPEQWLPPDRWDACADPARDVPDGAPIVIGFDGSYNRDATAIVGATQDPEPHLFTIGCWERPASAGEGWRVDVMEVEAAIAAACERWDVQSVACDPFRWQRTMQVLRDAGLPVIEWPSHQPSRMAPACGAFEDAVHEGKISHDGDERLARHIANAVTKTDSRGRRITKEDCQSDRHIDLAVAAVIALDMSRRQPAEQPFLFVG
jgi:phage terminase large subunit-like protein